MTKHGSEGELFWSDWVWEELIWTITKPIPSSASHHFCLRPFEWSQEFLRDLPVCGGRTWVWDHIQIPDLHTICQASAHMPFFTASLFTRTGILVFVGCFIHFCTAWAAQTQVAIYQYSMTCDPDGIFLWLTKIVLRWSLWNRWTCSIEPEAVMRNEWSDWPFSTCPGHLVTIPVDSFQQEFELFHALWTAGGF